MIYFCLFLAYVSKSQDNGFVNLGPLTIMEDGVAVTRYAVAGWSGAGNTNGTALFINHDGQIQLANSSETSYQPYGFAFYKLAGKTLSYTTDISAVGCSCNAAIYFTTMPGIGSDNNPDPGQYGDYYCDANDVGGQWCWEMDVAESNQYALAVTPHSCDQSPGQPIYNCDRGGCGTNLYNVDSGAFGPGKTIDTTRPFKQSIHFDTGNNKLDITLTQGSNTYTFNSCNDGGYLSNMNQMFSYNSVMIFSYWGTDYNTMSWLDGMTGCGGDCAGNGQAVFSDISIS